MKRLVLLGAALGAAATIALASLSGVVAAAGGPIRPFTREESTVAFKEMIAEQFPAAVIPPAEAGTLCSTQEFSLRTGPVFYCLAEFQTEGNWNQVAAAREFAAAGEPGGASVTIYDQTTWKREWQRCDLGRETPGKLLSNERCGLQQVEQLSQTDAELIAFRVLPKLRAHKPIRFVKRDDVRAPSLALFRVSKRSGVYTFTNAVGDSFRYRPPKRLGDRSARVETSP